MSLKNSFDLEEFVIEFEGKAAVFYVTNERGRTYPYLKVIMYTDQQNLTLVKDDVAVMMIPYDLNIREFANEDSSGITTLRRLIPYARRVVVKESLFESQLDEIKVLRERITHFLTNLYEYYKEDAKKYDDILLSKDATNPVCFLVIEAEGWNRAIVKVRGKFMGTIHYSSSFAIKLLFVGIDGKRILLRPLPITVETADKAKYMDQLKELQPYFPIALSVICNDDFREGQAIAMMDEIKQWLWRYYRFYDMDMLKLGTKGVYLVKEIPENRKGSIICNV